MSDWSSDGCSSDLHSAGGEGYRFLADVILRVDRINPQSAARLVAPLGRWRRFNHANGRLMRAELERIAAAPHLSKDVLEQVTQSLVLTFLPGGEAQCPTGYWRAQTFLCPWRSDRKRTVVGKEW